MSCLVSQPAQNSNNSACNYSGFRWMIILSLDLVSPCWLQCFNYTLKTEVLKITLHASFLTLLKSARRDNTRSVTLTLREV